MNLTLHLTDRCNMDCAYCTHTKTPARMSEEIVDAACDLAFSAGRSAGLCFFGGEPLLEMPLIYRAVSRCTAKSKETGIPVFYKMTTNGTLLTESFLAFARGVKIGIGLSFEGSAQDCCRVFADGSGTFGVVEEKAKLLLKYMPKSYALMTIAPQAVPQFADAVKYLYQLGFRNMTATIAYGNRVHWTDEDLALLEVQMREIAAFYRMHFSAESLFISARSTRRSATISAASIPRSAVISASGRCRSRRTADSMPARSSSGMKPTASAMCFRALTAKSRRPSRCGLRNRRPVRNAHCGSAAQIPAAA